VNRVDYWDKDGLWGAGVCGAQLNDRTKRWQFYYYYQLPNRNFAVPSTKKRRILLMHFTCSLELSAIRIWNSSSCQRGNLRTQQNTISCILRRISRIYFAGWSRYFCSLVLPRSPPRTPTIMATSSMIANAKHPYPSPSRVSDSVLYSQPVNCFIHSTMTISPLSKCSIYKAWQRKVFGEQFSRTMEGSKRVTLIKLVWGGRVWYMTWVAIVKRSTSGYSATESFNVEKIKGREHGIRQWWFVVRCGCGVK
jgi:hypothetical protein